MRSFSTVVLAILLLMGESNAALPNWLGTDAQPADVDIETSMDYTYIYNEVATDDGQIDSIQIYFKDSYATGTVQFAVFELTTGTTFRDTAVTQEWTPATGAGLQTLNLVDNEGAMTIAAGQYLGVWLETTGALIDIEKSSTGGPGYYYNGTDVIDSTVSDNAFTLSGNTTHDIQMRAYVTAVGGGGAGTSNRRRIIQIIGNK